MDDILITGSDVSMLQSVNILAIQDFLHLEKQPNHWGYRFIEIDQVGCLVFNCLHTWLSFQRGL